MAAFPWSGARPGQRLARRLGGRRRVLGPCPRAARLAFRPLVARGDWARGRWRRRPGRGHREAIGSDATLGRCATVAGLLDRRAGQLDVRADRLGHRIVQRVDPRGARVCARGLPPRAGGDGHHGAHRQLRRWCVRRPRLAPAGPRRGAPDADGGLAGLAQRRRRWPRHGAGRGDGSGRRLCHGRLLQLLGKGVRPCASGAHPGCGAGDDGACVGGGAACSGARVDATGSYAAAFYALAAVVAMLAVAAARGAHAGGTAAEDQDHSRAHADSDHASACSFSAG